MACDTELWLGHRQTVVMTDSGPMLQVDLAATTMLAPMAVVDFVALKLGVNVAEMRLDVDQLEMVRRYYTPSPGNLPPGPPGPFPRDPSLGTLSPGPPGPFPRDPFPGTLSPGPFPRARVGWFAPPPQRAQHGGVTPRPP